MNYMWEALLYGEEHGLTKNSIRFVPSGISNPYREVFFTNVNKPIISENPIEVNAYYRYSSVFGPLLTEDIERYSEFQHVLFDILAHYLSELDLRSGYSRIYYYIRFLCNDISSGLFGQENAERINYFSRSEKQLVSAGLLHLYQVGTSTRLVASLLRELYPSSAVYLDAISVIQLLIYIGKKEDKKLTEQLATICYLFIPADYSVKLFWEIHFGLIGVDETMEIGSIMMY